MSERASAVIVEAVHLFPTTMNTYGDRGNVAALTRRAALRDLTVRWHAVELGDEPPARCDLVFMGGGQDRVQHAAAADLARLRPWLEGVIAGGGVVFAVCAGLQLLGRRYVAADGSELPGLGLLDLETLAARPGEWRLIGNVVADVPALENVAGGAPDGAHLLVGFENHGGRTFLGDARPLGHVRFGFGNNGRDGGEGVNAGRLIATYLHGPVLPKNAWLTDHLLALAVAHAGGGALAPLAHPREDAAQREAVLVAERDATRRSRGRRFARLRLRSGSMSATGRRPAARRADAGVARLLDDFRSLLGPGAPPAVAGLEVECLYRTHVDDQRYELREIEGFGGDFVDFFRPGSVAQLVVTLGDVRGKGVKAAAKAIVAKYLVRATIAVQRWPLPPGEALRDVHNALLAVPHEPYDFVTVCIASIDARSGTVGLATAGHPSPIVLRATGIERPLLFANPAIGVTEDAELQALPSDVVELSPGEALLFYTDGLSEARDAEGRFYEDERLDQALEELRGRPAAQLLEGLIDDATAFAGHPPTDDVALVLVRRAGRAPAMRQRRSTRG